MPEGKTNRVDGPLAEFSALRAEILQCLQMQWNSFALQLTATAVIFSFSLSSNSRTGFLLILPVITYVLGSQFMNNYEGMQRIAAYIIEELSPMVPGGLRWEEWRRHYIVSQRGPTSRLSVHLPSPSIFPMVSIVALAWVTPYIWSNRHLSSLSRSLSVVVWVLDLGITAISFYSIRRVRKHYSARNPD
jgi:hypothetical protein